MNRRVTEFVAAGATAATNSEMRITKLQRVHLTSLTSLTRNFARNLQNCSQPGDLHMRNL
jgi:hypothetical protein